MKIGIITFHWATNYGAVLQSYALQTYLIRLGHDVRIIDYIPFTCRKKLIKCFITRRVSQIRANLLDYRKEKRISGFRKKYLHVSPKYSSYEDLKTNPPLYDVYICGSDQIWNPNFTKTGEGKLTLSYFLDFGGRNIKRIAYAASMGCMEYPAELIDKIVPSLSRFDAISVRENSGVEIMEQMGMVNVSIMPDPTLLLEAKDYDHLFLPETSINGKYGCMYTLHSGQDSLRHLQIYLSQKMQYPIVNTRSKDYATLGIEEWLGLITQAELVVTNSFHGMIFSILSKRTFVVTLVEGQNAGMNDRIFTLLDKIGLTDRILEEFDEERLDAILNTQINWAIVEHKISCLRENARIFFEKNLKQSNLDAK